MPQGDAPCSLTHPTYSRKRTSSFSFPSQTNPLIRPTKSPRVESTMGNLRRTESYLVLPGLSSSTDSSPAQPTIRRDPAADVPYTRTLKYYKEQRERRKALLNRSLEPITLRVRPDTKFACSQQRAQQLSATATPASTARRSTSPPKSVSPVPAPAPTVSPVPRRSSPLVPSSRRTELPGRPLFPRSKPEPDLYRQAITTCMKTSPGGQQILHMGPRLALSIMTATQELERIIATHEERDHNVPDVAIADPAPTPILTKSWVVVSTEDWEMVDCAA